MSKGNRVKGVFSTLLGCRMASTERVVELQSRKEGVPSSRASVSGKPKVGKAQRKAFKKMITTGDNENHPLSRKASVQELGYAKILSLVSRPFTKPEGSLYDKTSS